MRIQTFPPSAFTMRGQREYQQDALAYGDDDADGQHHFFIVCDGVGGSEHGELASQTVTWRMKELLDNVEWGKPFSSNDFAELLSLTYATLDMKASGKDTATTLVLLCFHQGGCLMAHIGDSRIYQLRPDAGIIYRSEDHSLVNDLMRRGKITPEEALSHPERHVITRCMQPSKGKMHDRATVRMTNDVRKGDLFLLCTDGVSDEIDDASLSEILLAPGSCGEKADRMAAFCEAASDNATAILVEVSEVVTGEKEQPYDFTNEVSPLGETVSNVSLWSRIKQLFNE